MTRGPLTERQWFDHMGERNLRAARIARLRKPKTHQRGVKRIAVIAAAAIAAWLLALFALQRFLPCDPMLQLEGRTPEFFRCVMERRR